MFSLHELPRARIVDLPTAPDIVAITETLCQYRVILTVPQLCQLPKFFQGSIYDIPEFTGTPDGTGSDDSSSAAAGATVIECTASANKSSAKKLKDEVEDGDLERVGR